MSKPNTTATMPQDIDSNPPYSDDDNEKLDLQCFDDIDEKLDLQCFDDMDDNNLLPDQPPFQEVPFPPNAAPTSTRAAKRTCSSPNDEHPSAWKSARTRSNSMESLSDLNKEVHQSNSNVVLFPDLELVLSEVSFDPELGDAADELATEYPREEDGELLSGSSQLENVSVHHDAMRTSPENGTSQARIQPYEAPFYYTLRCELRRALMRVEVEPSRGGGLDKIEIYASGSARLSTGVQKPNSPHNHRIVKDGILHDIIVWIAGSGSAPQIPMQEEQHRVFSEKKSQFHEVQSPEDSSTREVFIDLTLQRKNYALLQGDAGTTKVQLVVNVIYKDGSVDTKQAQEILVFSKPSRGLSSIDDAPIKGAIAAFHQALNHARSSASGNDRSHVSTQTVAL